MAERVLAESDGTWCDNCVDGEPAPHEYCGDRLCDACYGELLDSACRHRERLAYESNLQHQLRCEEAELARLEESTRYHKGKWEDYTRRTYTARNQVQVIREKIEALEK